METRVTFADMLTYGVRIILWRPKHVGIFVLAWTLITFAFYLWAASSAGNAFLYGVVTTITTNGQVGVGTLFAVFAALMLIGLLWASFFYAGAHRIMMRDEPSPWMPIRFGRDELHMIALSLVVWVMMLLMIVVMVVVALIASLILGLILGPLLGRGPAAGAVMAVILALIIYLPMIYVLGRAAVNFPLSIKLGRFTIAGWEASAPYGMALLGAHVVIFLGLLLVQLLFAWDLYAQSAQYNTTGMPQDPQLLASQMANPYGILAILAVPLQLVVSFIMLGPTAAVAAKIDLPPTPDQASSSG